MSWSYTLYNWLIPLLIVSAYLCFIGKQTTNNKPQLNENIVSCVMENILDINEMVRLHFFNHVYFEFNHEIEGSSIKQCIPTV